MDWRRTAATVDGYRGRVYISPAQSLLEEYERLAEDERANLCLVCGECLEKCPQMIEIPEWLAKAHDVLCQEEAE
mgnify:CR=1 FL=1